MNAIKQHEANGKSYEANGYYRNAVNEYFAAACKTRSFNTREKFRTLMTAAENKIFQGA